MKIIDCLLKALRGSAVYNPEIQVPPVCILWPDRDCQWEAVIAALQADLPELLILGDYDQDKRVGPAIWLRCVIAGQPEAKAMVPILYLPGVSRQDLRAVDSCPEHLKPLAELQYRGVMWSQVNAKDWTILAFIKSDQGGLGLDVAQDADTKSAMQLAFPRFLHEYVAPLKNRPLNKDYFNSLLVEGDPIKSVLCWLDQDSGFKNARQANEWTAFVEICKSLLGFNPQTESVLAGAVRLAQHSGAWLSVWERFCEAPQRYPNIPAHIRKCQMPPPDIFADSTTLGGWPQWNESEENNLRAMLLALDNGVPTTVRSTLQQLEMYHGQRRQLIWAELGEAPLALALEKLADIAQLTENPMAAGTLDEISAVYLSIGWKVDDAVLKALNLVNHTDDYKAVTAVIRALYLPWLEESARYLQKLVNIQGYPGGTISQASPVSYPKGQCVVFVDGLRFDTGKRLAERLLNRGFSVLEKPNWTALPSVTATGKAAISPVRDKIRGEEGSNDFEPCVAVTGQSLKGGYHLKKLLLDAGWHILDRMDNGDGQGNTWCEFGDIDHEGHDRGWKLSKQIDSLLKDIYERVQALLASGWSSVRIVTDHGWLLVPGGLPKIELSSELTENKWGRCACLKPGATSGQILYSWFWNPYQHFVLADGVGCFKKGEEYTHGGLSFQECLTLEIVVSNNDAMDQKPAIEITDVAWKGLRCTIAVEGYFAGLILDIRRLAGEATSSMVLGAKAIKDNGTASVVIENEDFEGQQAFLVLVDGDGVLYTQLDTVISRK